MTFKFSLQKILDLREIEAIESQKRVEATQKILTQIKELLESERQLYFTQRDLLNIAVKESKFHDVLLYENSLVMRQNKMMELLKALKDVQNELALHQATLISTKKNKKMIEKIHDIKRKEYEKIQTIKEQNTLDEIAVQRFLKSRWEEAKDE